MEQVERWLSDLSPDRREPFLLDLQNDCGCSYEIYDTSEEVVYLSGGTVFVRKSSRLHLPMRPEPATNSELDALLEAVSASPMPPHMADFFDRGPLVSKLPNGLMTFEPEYFGRLTANIYGWGAFCYTRSVFKPDPFLREELGLQN